MQVIEMMKSKLMNITEQDRDQHPIQDLAQNLTLDHVRGLAQVPGLDQDHALGLDPEIQEIDQGLGVEAVHGDDVPGLVVGHIHILGGGEDPDPDLEVHITTGTRGTCISFTLYCVEWWCDCDTCRKKGKL